MNEKDDFVEAFECFVRAEIRASGTLADYNKDAIEIIDARNHLFRNVGIHVTDEENGIYAIRDLCRVNEETLETIPDRMKFESLAKTFF